MCLLKMHDVIKDMKPQFMCILHSAALPFLVNFVYSLTLQGIMHYWQHGSQTMDIAELEQQAAQLERDLVIKERETLDVLKELETT